MSMLLSFVASAVTLAPPTVDGIEKVPEPGRTDVLKYVADKPVGGKAAIVDVEVFERDGSPGVKLTDVKTLLSETTGSDGGCRYREHTVSVAAAEHADGGNAEGSAGEYASDCCELTPDFPCDRTGADWMLHYDRARRAKNGAALARLAFKSFIWSASYSDAGNIKTTTRKFTTAQLTAGKGIDQLPAVDPLRMGIGCEPPDEKGYFTCSASQGGNHLTFTWRHVGDKTKRRFETKLVKIVSQED